MSWMEIALLIVGLGLLVSGAELLVKGASRLALAMGISPLVVGLTIVAFGTSSPELAVTVRAAIDGRSDVAFGNVVGSNILNVLLILGISALVAPLVAHRQLVRRELPIMVGVSALAFGMCIDGRIDRIDGLVLVTGGILYTAWTVVASRREVASTVTPADPVPSARRRLLLNGVYVGLGLGLLVIGANWLVDGAVAFARWAGLSDLVIGLTIVAAGTSLPEVATSILAALRGQRDIAIGNVVGSNIFNILVVLGVSSTLAAEGVAVSPAAASFDTPIMLVVAVACLPIFFTGWRIARWEGALFVAYYAAYTSYLVLDAHDHDAIHGFSTVMLWFALPLTFTTLVLVCVRQVRDTQACSRNRRHRSAR